MINEKILIYIILGIIFLLLCLIFTAQIKTERTTNEFNQIYTESLNQNLLAFASFLDEFSKNHLSTKETALKRSYNVNILFENYCNVCREQNNCYKKNKASVYKFLSNSIKYGHDMNFKNQDNDVVELIRTCIQSNEIINTGNMLKNRFESNVNDLTLTTQIDGVSNTLKNFCFDKNKNFSNKTNDLINILKLISKKKKILYYNIEHYSENNYKVEFYLKRLGHSFRKYIKRTFSRYGYKNINFTYNNEVAYYKILITPKLNYEVVFSAANLAKEGSSLSGDNHLIKNTQGNTKFIAALSDGMGSGYHAFNESTNTLKLVDKLTNSNILPNVFLNIMNTFFKLKDFSDIYATLDYVDFCRVTGELNIYKMGSATSFLLKSNGDILKIENTSMPLGVEQLIVSNTYRLDNDDTLYLFSDGLLDYIEEDTLINNLVSMSHQPAHKIVHNIMDRFAIPKNSKDDMSVLTLKIRRVA